ncbi:MAG TPA: glycosyltransferase [Thermoanaerobaculia bacterium]
MKIGVTSSHRYPARRFRVCGNGRAGARMTDLIARGLAELGHEVHYYVTEGAKAAPPPGVRIVDHPPVHVDVMHLQHIGLGDIADASWPPSVRTCHGDYALHRGLAIEDPIFVSRTHASSHGSTRWVHNGIDPDEFIFSKTKSDYFLFMCDLRRAEQKGLETALEATHRFGAKLVVAGSTTDPAIRRRTRELCARHGVTPMGEAMGARRAELFAGARALLFPTQLNESFGLVMAEALMSGTPVIASDRGACAEIISPEVGFICSTMEEYLSAMSRAPTISPHACRAKAMRDYHYLRMAQGYVREYEREIARAV